MEIYVPLHILPMRIGIDFRGSAAGHMGIMTDMIAHLRRVGGGGVGIDPNRGRGRGRQAGIVVGKAGIFRGRLCSRGGTRWLSITTLARKATAWVLRVPVVSKMSSLSCLLRCPETVFYCEEGSVQAATTAPLRDGSSSTSMVITNGTANVLPTPPSSSTIMPPTFNKKIPERPPPTGPSALRNVSPPKRALDPPAVISDKNSPPVVLDERVPGLRYVSTKLSSIDRPSTSTAVQAPPPQPISAPPPQPPPPVPRFPLPGVPEGLSIKIPTRVEDPSPADKRKIWEERIKYVFFYPLFKTYIYKY